MMSDAYGTSTRVGAGAGGGNHSSNNSSSNAAPPFTLSRDDVAAAFAFFDVAGTNVLTSASLKARLSAFYPDLTTREYRFLVEDARAGHGSASSTTTAATTTTAAAAAAAGAPTQAPSPTDSHVKPTGGSTAATMTDASTVNAAKTGNNNNAAAAAAAAASSSPGLTVDQLWELIDTFQRMYLVRAGGGEGDVSSSSAAAAGSGGGNAASASAAAAAATTTASPLHNNSNNNTSPTPSNAPLFDAIHEAFQVYDPRHTHAVDVQVLQHIMARIGFGALSEEEVALLVRTADYDGDGKITLDDFRRLVCAKGQLPRQQ